MAPNWEADALRYGEVMHARGQSKDDYKFITMEKIRKWYREKFDCMSDDESMKIAYKREFFPSPKDNPIEPNHYTDMKISPLEFIEANEDVLTWCTKNVIKYVGRYQRKNGLEDLKKAQWYLNHEIEKLEKENK